MISMPTWFFPAGAGPYSDTGEVHHPRRAVAERHVPFRRADLHRQAAELPGRDRDSRFGRAEGDPEDLRPDEHLGGARRLHDARRPVTGRGSTCTTQPVATMFATPDSRAGAAGGPTRRAGSDRVRRRGHPLRRRGDVQDHRARRQPAAGRHQHQQRRRIRRRRHRLRLRRGTRAPEHRAGSASLRSAAPPIVVRQHQSSKISPLRL